MRKIFFIFFISLDAFSQNWLPYGATWHTGVVESIFSANQGYIISSVIGDSSIFTKPSRLIQSYHYNSNNHLILVDTMWMYEDSGKIYHFANGQFYKLYDFNLLPGDTWQISVPYSSPYIAITMTSPDTVVNIIVDSISTIVIDGQTRKLQYVHSYNNDWYFLNPIIEGIGSAGGFFPYIYDWQDFDIPFLRCYTDSSLFYQRNSNLPCDTFINRISENEIIGMVAFPNPIDNFLKITLSPNHSQFQIVLFDSQGRECIRKEIKYGEQNIVLDVHKLVSGLYFCMLFNDHYKRIVKIIK
jgi:hypothetical protein